jgi:hypothetical protein
MKVETEKGGKLTLKSALKTIAPKMKINATDWTADELAAISAAYYVITKESTGERTGRIVDEGCNSCVAGAVGIIRNYLAQQPTAAEPTAAEPTAAEAAEAEAARVKTAEAEAAEAEAVRVKTAEAEAAEAGQYLEPTAGGQCLEPTEAQTDDLDTMTKKQMLAIAMAEKTPVNTKASNELIREAIRTARMLK